MADFLRSAPVIPPISNVQPEDYGFITNPNQLRSGQVPSGTLRQPPANPVPLLRDPGPSPLATQDEVAGMHTGTFVKGLRSGIRGSEANRYMTMAIEAAAAGDHSRAAMYRDLSMRAQDAASSMSPPVTDYRDVHDLGSAYEYAAGAAGQGLGSTLPSLIGGAGGMALATGAAAMTPAGRALLARGGLRSPAALGSIVGATIPGYQMERDEAVMTAAQDPRVMATKTPQEILNAAAVKGAVNMIPETIAPAIGSAMLAKRVMRPFAKATMGTVGKDVLQTMAAEGGTEALQEKVGQLAHGHLNPERDTSGDVPDIINAGLMGAISGPVLGAHGHLANLTGVALSRTKDKAVETGEAALDKGKELGESLGEVLSGGRYGETLRGLTSDEVPQDVIRRGPGAVYQHLGELEPKRAGQIVRELQERATDSVLGQKARELLQKIEDPKQRAAALDEAKRFVVEDLKGKEAAEKAKGLARTATQAAKDFYEGWKDEGTKKNAQRELDATDRALDALLQPAFEASGDEGRLFAGVLRDVIRSPLKSKQATVQMIREAGQYLGKDAQNTLLGAYEILQRDGLDPKQLEPLGKFIRRLDAHLKDLANEPAALATAYQQLMPSSQREAVAAALGRPLTNGDFNRIAHAAIDVYDRGRDPQAVRDFFGPNAEKALNLAEAAVANRKPAESMLEVAEGMSPERAPLDSDERAVAESGDSKEWVEGKAELAEEERAIPVFSMKDNMGFGPDVNREGEDGKGPYRKELYPYGPLYDSVEDADKIAKVLDPEGAFAKKFANEAGRRPVWLSATGFAAKTGIDLKRLASSYGPASTYAEARKTLANKGVIEGAPLTSQDPLTADAALVERVTDGNMRITVPYEPSVHDYLLKNERERYYLNREEGVVSIDHPGPEYGYLYAYAAKPDGSPRLFKGKPKMLRIDVRKLIKIFLARTNTERDERGGGVEKSTPRAMLDALNTGLTSLVTSPGNGILAERGIFYYDGAKSTRPVIGTDEAGNGAYSPPGNLRLSAKYTYSDAVGLTKRQLAKGAEQAKFPQRAEAIGEVNRIRAGKDAAAKERLDLAKEYILDGQPEDRFYDSKGREQDPAVLNFTDEELEMARAELANDGELPGPEQMSLFPNEKQELVEVPVRDKNGKPIPILDKDGKPTGDYLMKKVPLGSRTAVEEKQTSRVHEQGLDYMFPTDEDMAVTASRSMDDSQRKEVLTRTRKETPRPERVQLSEAEKSVPFDGANLDALRAERRELTAELKEIQRKLRMYREGDSRKAGAEQRYAEVTQRLRVVSEQIENPSREITGGGTYVSLGEKPKGMVPLSLVDKYKNREELRQKMKRARKDIELLRDRVEKSGKGATPLQVGRLARLEKQLLDSNRALERLSASIDEEIQRRKTAEAKPGSPEYRPPKQVAQMTQAERDAERGKTQLAAQDERTESPNEHPLRDRKAAEEYVHRALGKKIDLVFKKTLGGHSGEWTQGDTVNTIRISLNAGPGVLSTAFHESMHEFFDRLGKWGQGDTKELLTRVSGNPMITRQLERLLAEHPAAAAAMRASPEERLAYAYQFWASAKHGGPKFTVGPETHGFFAKIRAFFREILGMMSEDEKAEQIFQQFYDGKLATKNAAGKVIADNAAMENRGKSVREFIGPPVKAMMRHIMPGHDRMLESGNAKLVEIAKLFHNMPTTAGGGEGQGYLNARPQMTNVWLADLNAFLKDYDEETVKLAGQHLTGVKAGMPAYGPARELVEKTREFLSRRVDKDGKDTHFLKYLQDAGVPVKKLADFFPRVWNMNTITANQKEFHDLLIKHHEKELTELAQYSYEKALKNWEAYEDNRAQNDPDYVRFKDLTPQQQNALIKKGIKPPSRADFDHEKVATNIVLTLSAQNGVLDESIEKDLEVGKTALGEGEGRLGFTPYMAAINERKLKFLDMTKFGKFVHQDYMAIMGSYIEQGVRRAEYARRFGNQGEKLRSMLNEARDIEVKRLLEGRKIAELKPEQKKELFDKADKEIASYNKEIMAMEGTLGHDLSPTSRKWIGYAMVYQNARILPLALMSSFIDAQGVMVRGGTVGDAMRTFQTGVRELYASFSEAWRGEKGKAIADEARNNYWTRFSETMGTVDNAVLQDALNQAYTGMYMYGGAKRLNDKIFKWNGMEAWNRGMRIGATQAAVGFFKEQLQNPGEHTARWLEELGVRKEDLQLNADGTLKFTREEGLTDEQATRMRAGLQKWVDSAILRPNSAQRPAWASDPHWALIFHLKQFTYSFHTTILRQVIKEAKHGNFGPALSLASYIPVMLAADILRGMIQTGGGEPPWKQDWGPGEYLSYAAQRAGVFGLAQFGKDAVEYGPWTLGGPTADQVINGIVDPLDKTVMAAVPANPLFKNMIPSQQMD